MKKITLVSIALLFTTSIANASGRLSLQVNDYSGKRVSYPMIGLSIDERIIENLYVNGWVGAGQRPTADESKTWQSGKLGLEMRFDKVNVGAGVFANTGGGSITEAAASAEDYLESGAYVKASMKLW